MGFNRECEELLKSARFAFVKQDWSKAVNDLSELLNEVRDTDAELEEAMAPVHILYAFCILRQIANRDENAEEKPEGPVLEIEKNEDEGASSSSSMPGPSRSSGPAEEMETNDDDDLAELDEPAKSLMMAWEVLLLAKSIIEKFPTKANKFEELRAIELQAEILFHNNDEQCFDYLDKIVEELKNFPHILVWPIKVLTTKAAYLMRFKNYEKFAENLNIINGRLEDAMSEVQQPVGENFQKFFVQIKEDVKEMLAQEKAESKSSSKKDEKNVLQLNAEEMRGKIESKLLAACSPYPLAEDENGSQLSSRILDDVNEIISDGIEEEKKTSTKIVESEQIGFGSPPEAPSSSAGSSLQVRRKPAAHPESPDKEKRRVLLTSISTNGNGTH